MSGLEALGVAAGAVQLAQLGLAVATSLTNLFSQIRDAPKILQTRLLQVQTLVELSRLIASMPQLQMAEVDGILQSCVRDAADLEGVLQGLVVEKDGFCIKKWTKVLGSVVMEKKIVGLLHNLEVGKSALSLCITRIDSTLLYHIDSRLEDMRRDLEEVAERVKDDLPRLRAAIERLTLTDQQPDLPIKVASVSEKTEVCLSSLGAIDQTLFLSQILNRSKNSGGWILENRKYISWLESSKADLLWITAKAGCGKTTLSSHISQKVKELRPSEAQAFKTINLKPVVLFFFFHTSNLEIEGNATGALRNIVRQLVGQVPSSLPAVLGRYELLSSRGNFEWSSENLLSMIGDMLQLVPAGSFVYIILDALDECEPDSRRWLLDWLKELVDEEKSRETVTLSRSLLKIVVTSRPDEDIFDSLSDFPTLEMTASDTAIDMHTLIHSRISGFSRRRHLDVAASQKIISFLKENAHGMFLWAVLIMQDLERRDERLSDEVITAKLSSIPLTLFNTYETILKKVSPSRKKDMWRIFRWLLFAKRGLTFTELEIALCLETGVSRWHDFAGDVNFLCGAFLRFDGSRGEINMVHQTARDFFESFVRLANPEDVAGLDMSYREANAHLAQICIQYLLRDEEFSELCGLCDKKGPPIFPSVRWLQNFLGRHPFLYYAIENWASHVHALETPSTTLFNLIRTLFNSEKQKDGIKALTCFIDHGDRGALPMRQHPVHLAAYFNLPWFVEYCISLDSSAIHKVATINDTPLIWASEQGSTECVKMLLEAGANPDNFEWDGWSSLHWAARNGHVEVVKLLIDHGATLDHKDRKGNTPLEWAADREHWDVVEVLKSRVEKKELAKLEKFTRNNHPTSVIVSASRSRKGRLLRDVGPIISQKESSVTNEPGG